MARASRTAVSTSTVVLFERPQHGANLVLRDMWFNCTARARQQQSHRDIMSDRGLLARVYMSNTSDAVCDARGGVAEAEGRKAQPAGLWSAFFQLKKLVSTACLFEISEISSMFQKNRSNTLGKSALLKKLLCCFIH